MPHQHRAVVGRAMVPIAGVAILLAVSGAATASAAIVWSSKAPMPTARGALATATGKDGTVYAIGGYSGADLATTEAYDPVNNLWRGLAPMPTAREGLAAARLGKQIYAVGGFHSFVPLGTLQVYNPTTNKWRTKAPMPTPRGDLMAVAGADGKLYAIGGWNARNSSNDAIPLSTVEAYDPATNTWATMAPMPTPRFQLAGAVLGVNIYAIGGESESTNDLANVEVFDTTSNAWTALAPMPSTTDACNSGLHVTGRAALATAVKRGRIYAMGGTNEDFEALCGVLVYNPVGNTWASAAHMPTARAFLAATSSGATVFAIGGFAAPGSRSSPLSVAEAF
jgi:N-acetylneuraminic acid mutarotase